MHVPREGRVGAMRVLSEEVGMEQPEIDAARYMAEQREQLHRSQRTSVLVHRAFHVARGLGLSTEDALTIAVNALVADNERMHAALVRHMELAAPPIIITPPP